MPWAADRIRHQHALFEWTTIVRALPGHGEPVWLDMDEEYRFSKCVSGYELARTNAAGFYAIGQIRAGQLTRIIAHFC